jgi:Transcriptional regulator PadR-like family
MTETAHIHEIQTGDSLVGASPGGATQGKPRKRNGTNMRSRVFWAVLGLVIERESYGYDLGRRFEQLYGDLLPLSGMPQIYMALDVLRNRSLVEQVPHDERSGGGRPRPTEAPGWIPGQGRG